MHEMKVSHGVVQLPITQAETEPLRVLWNEFVTEWNRRERDHDEPLPCSSDAWSAIKTLGWLSPANRAHFRPKGEPDWVWYRLYMRRGWRQFEKGWSCRKHEIAPADLLRGERLIFLTGFPYRGHAHYTSLRAWRRDQVNLLETVPDAWRTGAAQ